jgi:hypothetical protein
MLIVPTGLAALAGGVPDLVMTPLQFTAAAFVISVAAAVLGSLLVFTLLVISFLLGRASG